MNGKAVIPSKSKHNEYFRLYITIINMYKKKKTWIGAESKNVKMLEEIGEHAIRGDKKTKFYITKIVETRI